MIIVDQVSVVDESTRCKEEWNFSNVYWLDWTAGMVLPILVNWFSTAGRFKGSISYVVLDCQDLSATPNKVLWPCHIQKCGTRQPPYENWNMNS